jgi:Outer membrane protein beta-barrel domain
MSKEEQFEHIENKIKQAIQNNPPAFDEKAWDKMEALLDKDEKKPRPFYWMWFLLSLVVLGTGGVYFYSYKNSHKISTEKIAGSSNNDSLKLKANNNNNIVAEDKLALTPQKNKKGPVAETEATKPGQLTGNISTQKNRRQLKDATVANQSNTGRSKSKIVGTRKKIINTDADVGENSKSFNLSGKIEITDKAKTKIKVSENTPAEQDTMIADKNENKIPDIDEEKTAYNNDDRKEPLKINNTDSNSSKLLIEKDKKKPVLIADNNKKNKPAQGQKKLLPRFYLLGSFGADIGSVKLFSFDNSSLAAKYGAGVGYQLNNKWSLQTGIYAGKKKYIAGPNDYHPKRTLPNYIKIIKVSAECVVYEIPLTIRYDISRKSSISYYTAIGLSSYLMKKEDYNFYSIIYNTPNEFDTIYTGNKHLFSNLTISAGIEKKVSKSLSFQLEPSVSLPLSGVGYGKVKLFSTAIMLGVKYLPFQKRK